MDIVYVFLFQCSSARTAWCSEQMHHFYFHQPTLVLLHCHLNLLNLLCWAVYKSPSFCHLHTHLFHAGFSFTCVHVSFITTFLPACCLHTYLQNSSSASRYIWESLGLTFKIRTFTSLPYLCYFVVRLLFICTIFGSNRGSTVSKWLTSTDELWVPVFWARHDKPTYHVYPALCFVCFTFLYNTHGWFEQN